MGKKREKTITETVLIIRDSQNVLREGTHSEGERGTAPAVSLHGAGPARAVSQLPRRVLTLWRSSTLLKMLLSTMALLRDSVFSIQAVFPAHPCVQDRGLVH